MSDRIVPVGALTSYIRELFDRDPLLQDVWIEGEVSESFAARSGHHYFTLRDEKTQLRCVLFKREAARQRHLPREGDQITIHARVSVYEATGQYQAYVDVVQPAGVGIQALLFEQLRQKLEAEGLFDIARKRPIPIAPKWIGVVTSLDGAVWHDIQTVLRRRYPLVQLVVAGATVQGDAAPRSLIAALNRIQDDGRAEVVIVARGGGSVDDLSCFNDEALARAVFACRIPVVSAVGHETDWTIIDLVADVRAPTPSAAAELCSPDGAALLERIALHQRTLFAYVATELRNRREEIRAASVTLRPEAAMMLVDDWRSRLAAHTTTLASHRQSQLDARRTAVATRRQHLGDVVRASVQLRRAELDRRQTAVAALSPVAVLQRGYAFVHRQGDDRAVTSVAHLAVGANLVSVFADGSAMSRIDGIASGSLRGQIDG